MLVDLFNCKGTPVHLYCVILFFANFTGPNKTIPSSLDNVCWGGGGRQVPIETYFNRCSGIGPFAFFVAKLYFRCSVILVP